MARTGLPALEGWGCPYRYRNLLLPREPEIFDQRLQHRFLEGSGCSKPACQKGHIDAVSWGVLGLAILGQRAPTYNKAGYGTALDVLDSYVTM